jgi:hypothetical protein
MYNLKSKEYFDDTVRKNTYVLLGRTIIGENKKKPKKNDPEIHLKIIVPDHIKKFNDLTIATEVMNYMYYSIIKITEDINEMINNHKK